MILLGWKVVAGYNDEPLLRFGVHRERMGKGGFVAVGCWPLLIGFSWCRPDGSKW